MAKKAESGGYARLKGDLAQKTPGSFYVLYGEEDYLRQRGDVHEEVLRMLLRTLDKEKLRLGDDARNLQIQARMRKSILMRYYAERKKREDEWK